MTRQKNTPAYPQVPWWVLCLCVAVSIVGIFGRDLWTPDEPRAAAISLEMSRTGDVIVPHLAGEPFVEKPPLYFAVAAAAIRAIGPLTGSTGAIRFTSALWGLGTLFMTFLIARQLTDVNGAMLAVAMLATMSGFVENMHWIRVDAALAFFVTSAIWSFCEAYLNKSPWLLPAGGAFTAGAFLAKGMIGPVLVGIAWLGLVIPWLVLQKREQGKLDVWVYPHLACLLVFACAAGSWIVALRVMGGEALWREWFWENHVGRLTGTAMQLGHMRPGRPLYYVKTVTYYGLPWLPLVVMWFSGLARDLYRHRSISQKHILLLVWSIGSILVLSLSVTKRDVYLLPVLPSLAVMSSLALADKPPRWIRMFFAFWLGLCVVSLAAMTFSPLIIPFIPVAILQDSRLDVVIDFLDTFTLRHLVATMGLGACLYMIFKRSRMPVPVLWIAVTAAMYIAVFAVGGKAIDLVKSMKNNVVSFAERIPPDRGPRVAGRHFSETMRAFFYYYCDWAVPQVNDRRRLQRILAGKDPQFDSVINGEPSIPELPGLSCRVLAEAFPGDATHKRRLYWIEGRGDQP